ncbi:hypothetical protein C0989_004188 [Termitomyces sp. Mn162]|nr:hypothetical protein C0989_004188 [Termitomyces sp. Mn162]
MDDQCKSITPSSNTFQPEQHRPDERSLKGIVNGVDISADSEISIHTKRSSSPTAHSRTSIPKDSGCDHESTDVVGWDGPDDSGNPRNWTKRRRWVVTLVVSLFTFISPVGSSISSPALPEISRDLGIMPGSSLENMSLSIFVLAYALGFGGAAPQSLGGGVVGDLWSPEERGMAMSIYSLAPLVGPSTGPLVGGWIAERTTWPWTFWSVSIADALVQIVGFIFLRETYAPELLKRRARMMRKRTGNKRLRSTFERPDRHWTAVIARGMVKPIVFLATEPIVQVFALYMAVLYGVLYLSITSKGFLAKGEVEGLKL